MNRPKIKQPEVERLIEERYHGDILETVKVVAIRGYYRDTMGKPGENDRGIYDDAIILIGPNYYQTFNANTDPSKYKKGVAKLIPDLHYFKKGKHGISKPGGGYPAFRPDTKDEGLDVTRDGSVGIFRGIAINIHKGGYNTTSSDGCQTIHPDQWLEFQQTAYKLMTQEGIRSLPYLLIEQT